MTEILINRLARERYELLEPVGRGGMAELWRARRVGGLLERDVCVKRPLRRDRATTRALVEEARVMARVNHASVVAVLDVGEDDDGVPFIVMELVRGADLRHVRARAGTGAPPRLSTPVVAAVATSVCRALAAAQRALPGGVLHRDVTPHNILVSVEGEVKLTDFGVARASDRESWTATGNVKGKPSYLSPEQVSGSPCDVRSDLFSLGVVLYEALSGVHPFRRRCPLETVEAIAEARCTALADLTPRAPAPLIRCIEQLLALSPQHRPRDPEEAASLFAQFRERGVVGELRWLALRARGPGIASARPKRTVEVGDSEAR